MPPITLRIRTQAYFVPCKKSDVEDDKRGYSLYSAAWKGPFAITVASEGGGKHAADAWSHAWVDIMGQGYGQLGSRGCLQGSEFDEQLQGVNEGLSTLRDALSTRGHSH